VLPPFLNLVSASMGPRPFDRGRPGRSRSGHRERLRFNGSTAFRPWETVFAGSIPVSAYQLQWVHGLSTVGDLTMLCPFHLCGNASMGPRPFDRGRPLDRKKVVYGGGGFNGSTAFRPWETTVLAVSLVRSIALQWVHGLSTVGDLHGHFWSATNLYWLQWVHGLSTVGDRQVDGAAPWHLARFNGSTAFRPWETHLHAELCYGGRLASMGPRPFDRGRRLRVQVACTSGPEASMGPRPFDRGRRRTTPAPRRCRGGFNGSTAFRPWETPLLDRADRVSGQASMGPRPFDRGRLQGRRRCGTVR